MAIRIKTRTGESVQQMMRRFKKLCEKEGLTKEVKKRPILRKAFPNAAVVPLGKQLLGWCAQARKRAAVAADPDIFGFSLTHFVPLIRSPRINDEFVCVNMPWTRQRVSANPSFSF